MQNEENSVYYLNTEKMIMLLKIECEIIATPLSVKDTIDWYRKERMYEPDEPLDVNLVDITKDGMWVAYNPDESVKEAIYTLYNNIKDLKELVVEDNNTEIHNIRLYFGELEQYVSFKEYCMNYINSDEEIHEPKIIASSEC